MLGKRKLFNSLDESQKVNAQLMDNKEMNVQGVGTVSMCTQNGDLRQLQQV